ncbi:SMI1/KNR4 family protein, partial [Streptomyces sp. SID8380]|nr:SMI1/KNR4 family protein [Streptomyces sp. SID8380]
LPPAEWRALLAADAVPRGLLAAAIEPGRADSPLTTVALANEILGRWERPPIAEQVVSGTLG